MPTLTSVAFGATYAPAFYRELTAALRSGLRGDREPLLRLVAEAIGGGTDAGTGQRVQRGSRRRGRLPRLPAALRHDGAARRRARAAATPGPSPRGPARSPDTYGPFTVREYADSDWQLLDWCTRWPVAAADNPAGPIQPAGGYPDVPVLVLSGELDSITTAAEGDLVAGQFPNARHVVVRNSFHVTRRGRPGQLRRTHPAGLRALAGLGAARVARCAKEVEPVRALGIVPAHARRRHARRAGRALPTRLRRAGPAAALTVADVMDRWWNNYSGSGVGLHGGTFSYTGNTS